MNKISWSIFWVLLPPPNKREKKEEEEKKIEKDRHFSFFICSSISTFRQTLQKWKSLAPENAK